LEILAADPDHSDWQLIKGHIRLSEKLPPSTFDTICTLGENPQAAALAVLIVTEGEPELFDVCWRALKSLPFSWLAVSRSIWETAFIRWMAARYAALRSVQDEGVDPAQLVNTHCFEPVRRVLVAEQRMPWLSPLFELARAQVIGTPVSPDTHAFRHVAIRDITLGRYWDAIGRIAPAPLDGPDPVPRTYELYRNLDVLADRDATRLRTDRSRQVGVIGDARVAYLNAPAIAAACAVMAQPLTAAAQVELRDAYEYDPSWFGDAYYSAYLYLLGAHI
jgi:hypothetical protein